MFRTYFLVGCCIAVVFAGNIRPVQAQAKAIPIDAAHAGVDRLYEDLDYLFGLVKEPQALKDLKGTLDVYFRAVDPKLPTVSQVYVRKGKFNTVLQIPTLNAMQFRNNIRLLGLKSRYFSQGVYVLSGLFNGFLKETGKVSIIAEDRADLVVVGQGKLAKFKAGLAPQDYDFVASIVNLAAQKNDREGAIEEVRKQVMPGLKKLKDETDAQFELRKLTIDQQITEIKQIYGEAKTIFSFVDVDPAKKSFISATDLTALEGTDLAKAIDQLAKEPSYFANIPFNDKEPLSGTINLKLDALRQQHFKNFLVQARPLMQQEIKESETNSAKTKEYTSISTGMVFDVLEKSCQDAVFDSFINVQANASGLHTMVGGTKVDGEVVKAGLQKLKDTAKVEMDAGKIGDVDLHKVTLPADLTELNKIYGKDLVLVLGTSPQAVWYAMGEDAEAKLKEAIEKVGQPAPAANNVVIRLHGKALTWYELFDAYRTKHKQGDIEDRKRAIAAFKAGDDIFDFKMEKIGDKLSSTLTLNEGILRYFGTVAAEFVKKTLAN